MVAGTGGTGSSEVKKRVVIITYGCSLIGVLGFQPRLLLGITRTFAVWRQVDE